MQPDDVVPVSKPDAAFSRLSNFVPRFQRERVLVRGSPPGRATQHDGWGALLFVDISGFTAMTQRLDALGPRGAEQMSNLLNQHYGALVDLVTSFSGDVVAFAGDAVLALWPVSGEAALREATRLAAACALAIQKSVAGRNASAEEPLKVRAALGAGSVSRFELGGEAGRWHWLVAGEAIEQAALVDALAQPGQVVVSPPAAALLSVDTVVALDNGAAELLSLREAPQMPSGMPLADRDPAQDHSSSSEASEIDGSLAAFVPAVVRERLAAGQSDFLAEFRHVSVAFAGIRTTGVLDELQNAVHTVQQVLERFDGTLYQCLSDDKGFVVIMVFGIPPLAHENDAERALLASMAVAEALPESASIGVASGRVFCGAYGGVSRQQYSLVGTTMNLAARLMQAADGGVLCDGSTAAGARDHVKLVQLGPLTVKGRDEPVTIFEPTGRRSGVGQPPQRHMVGRAAELDALAAHVEPLVDAARTLPRLPPVIVEAEAGMGKSTLIAALMQTAEVAGIRVIVGHADAIESHTAYHPFREILAQFLDDAPDADARLAGIMAESPIGQHVSLLNALRPGAGVNENEVTAGLSAAARADKTNQLLLHVFEACSQETPTVLVLEDGHWLDSASWVVLQQAAGRLSGCAIVVTTRPLDEKKPELESLREEPGAHHVELTSLDTPSLVKLVGACLGVESLPEAFSRLITERAGGNPFYAQEIAFSLRDAGVVAIDDGRLRVVSAEALSGRGLPENLHGVITSRIDALPAAAQLAVKVASVIGRSFESAMLTEVHPQASRPEELAETLAALTAADLVVAEPGRAKSQVFRFRHAVIQDSVYALLSFDQRRSLHRSAANHLEKRHVEDRDAVLTRLAHHYSEAEMATEAMAAARDAGSQAVATFANREAIRFLQIALQFESASATKLNRLEKTTIHSQLADAHYGMTDYERTLEHAHQAVREAGYRAPRGGWGIPAEFCIMLLHSIREHRQGRREALLAGVRREERLTAMETLGTSLTVLIFLARNAEYLETALKLHNLAAGLEPSAQSAACRSALGLCFAMLGWKRRAERDLRRALAEAQELVNPDNLSQCYSLLGMFLHMQGQLEEASECSAQACAVLEATGQVGMWHHRAKMNHSTALAAQGLFEEAAESYAETAALTWEAEPQVYGLIVSLRGLALLRAGRRDDATLLLEEGVRRSRDHDSALPLFASLGALAELELQRGDIEQAVAVAFEAEATARKSGEVNSYLQGASGHTGICCVFCEMLAAPDSFAKGSTLSLWRIRRLANRASRKFRRFARKFVCFEPHYLALDGLRRYHLGHHRRALKLWARAREQAVSLGLPYEERLANYFLGCHERGERIQAWGDVQTVTGK